MIKFNSGLLKDKFKTHLPFFNKYVIAALLFLVWMIFFDKYRLSSQIHLTNKLNSYTHKKADLEKGISELKIQQQSIDVDKEKYARERYLMHKENEDIFIIKK